jgi:hypothetical protein
MEEGYSQEELFRRLEERLLQSDVRKSAEDVAALLAGDFIEFGSSGRIFNKQQIIAALQDETSIRISLTNFRVQLLAPDVSLITYLAIRLDATENQSASSLRSSIWKLIEGRWQIVFHQGTLSENK